MSKEFSVVRYKFDVRTEDLIVWRGWIVMSRSEAPFFERMIKRLSRLRPSRVLEIGFGLGVSASLIQQHLSPSRHDIVEIDSSIFEGLRKFARQHRGVQAIRGDFWTFTANGRYDFIFYDPFDYVADDAGSKKYIMIDIKFTLWDYIPYSHVARQIWSSYV